MKVLILLSVLVVGSLADIGIKSGYNYPRPQGARLELPLPTTTDAYETTTLNRQYLPAETTAYPEEETEDPLSVQGLPSPNPPRGYTGFNGVQPPQTQFQPPPQSARFSELDDFKSQFFASQHQLQFGSRNGRLQVAFNGGQNRLGNLEEQPQVPQVRNPTQLYGPPKDEPKQDEDSKEVEEVEQEEDTPRDASDEEEEAPEQNNGQSKENLENQSQENDQPSNAPTSIGEYYILAPDNTLQKVQFRTLQTEDDRRGNGFTAQLRYTPVEPVKPPVYGYNEQGQLVRILRK